MNTLLLDFISLFRPITPGAIPMWIIIHRLISPFLRPALTFLAFLVTSTSLQAADEARRWTTEYSEAIAASKKSGLPILANFTWGDWCPACVKLHNEVFATDSFKEWAAKNVVLLEIEFPIDQNAVEAKKQEIKTKYEVEYFPTIVILDSSGSKLGQLGYQTGGPMVWIAEFTKQHKAGGGK